MIQLTEITPIKLPGLSSIKVEFNYSREIVDTVKQIPNAIYHKTLQCWEIPTTSLARAIELLSNYDELSLNFLQNVDKKEDFTYDLSNFKTTPYQYQKDGINFGLNHDKFLLLDAPGLGKTLQMIYLAQELKKRDNIEHCLIICGINTLKHNWKKEIQIHSDLSCRILGERVNKKGKVKIGSVNDRLEDLKNPIEEFFVVTNIETLRDSNIIKELTKGKTNKFDMIVADELHMMKSPTSQQGKNFLKLSAKYQVGLTGTLLTNSPLDAYVPLKWLGVDNSTYTNFKFYYCNFSGPFNNILTGYKNIDVLKDEIERFSLRRTKDMLDLPPKTIIHEFVDMNERQAKFYQDITDGIVDEVDKVELNTSTLLSMVTRLRQTTACPSILTTEDIESSKITRAIDLAKQIIDGGDKVVIFSVFKETLNKIYEGLSEYNPLLCTGDISDDIISHNIDMFQNADDNKVMCATTAKMGTGITLTRASYAIFIDAPWTAAACQQAEDRIHRLNSEKPVFIYYLWAKDTIDERVKEIVEDKEAISDFVVDDKISTKSMESLKKYILDL